MSRVSFTHPSGRQSTKQPKGTHGTDRLATNRSSCQFFIFSIVVVFLFTLAAKTSRAGSPEKPNILFIAIDDLNDWVGFLDGHLEAVTPNMDALAKKAASSPMLTAMYLSARLHESA